MTTHDEQREQLRRARVAAMMKRQAEPLPKLKIVDGVAMAVDTVPWWEPESDGFQQQSLFPETASPTP